MSTKITNDSIIRSGTAVPYPYGNSGRQRVNSDLMTCAVVPPPLHELGFLVIGGTLVQDAGGGCEASNHVVVVGPVSW